MTHIPARKAHRPADTTGAGDAFCGAFAAAIAQGRSPAEAAQVAVRAGAHMVQHAGAVAGLAALASKHVPGRWEVTSMDRPGQVNDG